VLNINRMSFPGTSKTYAIDTWTRRSLPRRSFTHVAITVAHIAEYASETIASTLCATIVEAQHAWNATPIGFQAIHVTSSDRLLHHRSGKLLQITKPQRANGILQQGAIVVRDVRYIPKKLKDAITSPVSFVQWCNDMVVV